MDDQHTPGTVMNSVFYLIYSIVSLYVALFIEYIGIIIITCIHLCYVHCLCFIYWRFTISFV